MADAPKILGTDSLRQAYPKLNSSIDNSNAALSKSANADINSVQAKAVANSAKSKAENVQEQFNQVVINGDSSVEAAQARVDSKGEAFPTLKARLDNTDEQISEKVFYEEISYEKLYDSTSKTWYYLTKIPHLDSEGNLIKLKHGFSNDVMNSPNAETPRQFSTRVGASLTINASIWNTSTQLIKGVQIQDGVIKQNNDGGNSYTLGVKADNSLVMYPPSVSAEAILADGCVNAFTAFFPMIQNGSAVNASIYNIISNPSEPNPRQVIAQMPNKDLVILTTEGRTALSVGMTYADCIRVLMDVGVNTAYCLDGGGSAQTVLRGVQMNPPVDGSGKTERATPDFIYFSKQSTLNQNFKITSKDIGDVNKKIYDLVAEFLNLGNVPIVATNKSNLDEITASGFYWASASAVGAPSSDKSWGILHFQAGAVARLQIGFPYHSTAGEIMLRRGNSDGSWNQWSDMTGRSNTFTNLPLESGVSGISGRVPRYTKIGNQVFLDGEISNTNAGQIIGYLPSGFRPSSVKVLKGALNSTAANDGVTFVISTNGAITLQSSANETSQISLAGISFFTN